MRVVVVVAVSVVLFSSLNGMTTSPVPILHPSSFNVIGGRLRMCGAHLVHKPTGSM